MTKTQPNTREQTPATDKARTRDEAILVKYLKVWELNLAKLQRRHPGRWCVRGWSDEEVRDALTLHLFEAAQSGADARRQSDDWELELLTRRVRELQRGSRLNVTVMDLSDAPLLQREPSHEELYLELEDNSRRATAAERARENLNQPQRRWLAAMQWTANRGDFFEASDRLNLTAASRVIGKSRSSAARAYKELQSRFQSELERLE